MSAEVKPFTGKWHGQFEPTPYTGRSEAAALHDARLILSATRENDDWTARLLLALVETLSSKQRELLEFRLRGPEMEGQSTAEAVAIVRLIGGTTEHRALVRAFVARLAKREAE